jgi:hypothetical protein
MLLMLHSNRLNDTALPRDIKATFKRHSSEGQRPITRCLKHETLRGPAAIFHSMHVGVRDAGSVQSDWFNPVSRSGLRRPNGGSAFSVFVLPAAPGAAVMRAVSVTKV